MRLKSLLWSVVFFVLPFVVMAQDNNEALIEELYDKSGMEKQVGQMPLFVQMGFDQAVEDDDRLKAMPRSVVGEIRESIEAAFAPNDIKKAIIVECREKLSLDDLGKVLGWLNSPLGRQFTQLEEAASTPEIDAEIQRFAQKLKESPPLPERLKIIRRLDSAVKATETGVDVAMNMQLAITIAIVASLPKEQQPPNDRLAEMVEEIRPQIEDAMREQTLIGFLFTYQSVTFEELDKYIAFASSPASKHYHNATASVLIKALISGSYQWGEKIADIIEQSKSKTEA